MNPKVSIIIPLYNSEKTIRGSVESCLNQTYDNIEIIVIDDGSTDNSKLKIADYIYSNSIKYVYQENNERSSARNRGLDIATGKYVNLLDSDDFLYKDKLCKEVMFLEANTDFFAVYSGVEYIKNMKCVSVSRKNYRGASVIDDLVLGNFIPIQSVLFRKNEVKFNEGISVLEDWVFFLNVFYEKKVFYLDEVLSAVQIDGQLSRDYVLKMLRCSFPVFCNIIKDNRYHKYRFIVSWSLFKSYVKYFLMRVRVM